MRQGKAVWCLAYRKLLKPQTLYVLVVWEQSVMY